mgnify:CR=1 FL=1
MARSTAFTAQLQTGGATARPTHPSGIPSDSAEPAGLDVIAIPAAVGDPRMD